MQASIIITGSEILRGMRRDSLIQPFAAMMASRGIAMSQVRIIGDEPEALCAAILDLAPASDVIVVTGGLGLTPDDTTHLAVKGLQADRTVRMKPEIDNPVGSAKGIELDLGSGTRILFFPGVPAEAFAMFRNVIDRLNTGTSPTVEIAVFGLREVEIAKRLGPLADSCGYLPRDMEVSLIVPLALEQEVRKILGVHALEGSDINTTLGELLRRKRLTVATAESCTGGLIAHLITQIPGSSDYFLGSVVSYSNDLKERILHIPGEVITRFGAVSREVAREMLRGVLEITGADVGMATTGIAGPSGGSEEKPVGTVWIAAGRKDDHIVREFHFSFDRQRNKMIYAKTALFLLRSFIHDTDIHRP